MSLYPTKTRLALLRAVSRREVTLYAGSDSYRDDVSPGRRCTSYMVEMERAGWVQRPAVYSEGEPWDLSSVGRAVLDAASSKEAS